jgi:hypothetical protein
MKAKTLTIRMRIPFLIALKPLVFKGKKRSLEHTNWFVSFMYGPIFRKEREVQ